MCEITILGARTFLSDLQTRKCKATQRKKLKDKIRKASRHHPVLPHHSSPIASNHLAADSSSPSLLPDLEHKTLAVSESSLISSSNYPAFQNPSPHLLPPDLEQHILLNSKNSSTLPSNHSTSRNLSSHFSLPDLEQHIFADSEPFSFLPSNHSASQNPSSHLSLHDFEQHTLADPKPSSFLPSNHSTSQSPSPHLSLSASDQTSPVLGTIHKPIVIHENSSLHLYKDQIERDRKLLEFYKNCLSDGEPVALLANELETLLNQIGLKRVSVGGKSLTSSSLYRLLPREWLDVEIMDMHMELLVAPHRDFQVLSATHVQHELDMVLISSPGHKPKAFDIRFHTRSLLIPHLVGGNHWILFLATFSESHQFQGSLRWYNSLQGSSSQTVCQEAASQLTQILRHMGTHPNSRLTDIAWDVQQGVSGIQSNFYDCGVFVLANASAIVQSLPLPMDVADFRLIIARDLIQAAKDGIPGSSSVPTQQMMEFPIQQSLSHSDLDAHLEASSPMSTLELDCTICWCYTAESSQDLHAHVQHCHNPNALICEWPGCPATFLEQPSLDQHHSTVHELKTWVCPHLGCHIRFLTEDDARNHISATHPIDLLLQPMFLKPEYRRFALHELRKSRRLAQQIWEARCGSLERQRLEIARLYAAYHSQSGRAYFAKKGILNQDTDAISPQCRTISTLRMTSGQKRPRGTQYSCSLLVHDQHVRTAGHPWHWWVRFYHLPEGPILDKFISNTILGRGWCQTSHICHHPFCFVVTHLEQLLLGDNCDRSICKNRTREGHGGCNALTSHHPFSPRLLSLPWGLPFTTLSVASLPNSRSQSPAPPSQPSVAYHQVFTFQI